MDDDKYVYVLYTLLVFAMIGQVILFIFINV